ncbi:hypothetical protein [Paenibacillus sp. CMAA1364]
MNRIRYQPISVFKITCVLMMLVWVTTGCLSPTQETSSQPSYHESVKRIQSAVDDYQKEFEILPIINADQGTPKYEKFRVDLVKLKDSGYMDEIPNTAFEKGGNAYFLIINEETDPTVKVMDLMTVQKVNDVQRAVDQYARIHANELPLAEEIAPEIHNVDLMKVGIASTKINSVYSNKEMGFVIDKEGQVYVDYTFDIMQAIDMSEHKPQGNEDLREYLVSSSYFVPVKSLKYSWVDGSPQASME